jgi:predicted restriction endonuclease
VHHRKLRKHGGTNDIENLMGLCSAHHAVIHQAPQVSYAEGWLIHAWDDISPWPERWFR